MTKGGAVSEKGELAADVAVQAIGLAASLVGVAALVRYADARPGVTATIAAVTYGVTLIAMFSFSLLNALLQNHPRRSLVQMLDHAAIYLLIAGTYTPFCLLGLGGRDGWLLLGLVWLGALLGVAIRVLLRRWVKTAVITLYLLLGWSGLTQLDAIIDRLPLLGCLLLGLGGILYSVGAPFHRLARLRYHSAIWHGFVLGGAGCHYAAILVILS